MDWKTILLVYVGLWVSKLLFPILNASIGDLTGLDALFSGSTVQVNPLF
jgi:hypothetical protein